MIDSMHEEKTEGIVLRSQDYKERHRIITLFSPHGLISLIVKSISRKNARLLSLTTPFCHGEYIYRQGSPSSSVSMTAPSSMTTLLCAKASIPCKPPAALANAILTSQMPGKPAPALFALYKSYHKQVSHSTILRPCSPVFTSSSLSMKAFFPSLPTARGARKRRRAFSFKGKASAAHTSTPPMPYLLPPQNGSSCFSLDEAQQFSTLRTAPLPPSLLQKIQTLFLSRLAH